MLLLMLTNCAGSNMAKVKFGKRCTAADEDGLKESSYVWVISKEALKSFDKLSLIHISEPTRPY